MWRKKLSTVLALAVVFGWASAAWAEQVDPSLVGVWSTAPPGVTVSNLTVFELGPDGHYRILTHGASAPSVIQGEMAAIGGRWSSRDQTGRMDWGTYQFVTADTVVFTGTGGTATWYRTPIEPPEPLPLTPVVAEAIVVYPEYVQQWFDIGVWNFCLGRFNESAFFFCRAGRFGHHRACRQYAWHCEHGVGVAADLRSAQAWREYAERHRGIFAGQPNGRVMPQGTVTDRSWTDHERGWTPPSARTQWSPPRHEHHPTGNTGSQHETPHSSNSGGHSHGHHR